MKPKPTIRRFFSLILALTFVCSMMPSTHVHATEGGHTHEWHTSWSTDETHHWHACTGSGTCDADDTAAERAYGAHDWDSTYTYRCKTCNYRKEHTCTGGTATCKYQARCELCGVDYGNTNPENHQHRIADRIDAVNHKVYCAGCDHVYVESESHSFGDWEDAGDGTQSRACSVCYYYETQDIPHVCTYGEWISNGNGTHTHTCTEDSSHTETADCSDGSDDNELCDDCGYDLHTHSYTRTHNDTHHWDECSCGDEQNKEAHEFTYTYIDDVSHRVVCEGCDYVSDKSHNENTVGSDDESHWITCKYCDGKLHFGSHTFDDEDQYCNGVILYDNNGDAQGSYPCPYDRHEDCESDGNPFGPYSITDTAHERICKDCGLTVRENHTVNTYMSDAASHTGVCACGKSLGESAHTWMPASTHSSLCFDCGYYLDNLHIPHSSPRKRTPQPIMCCTAPCAAKCLTPYRWQDTTMK